MSVSHTVTDEADPPRLELILDQKGSLKRLSNANATPGPVTLESLSAVRSLFGIKTVLGRHSARFDRFRTSVSESLNDPLRSP